MASGFLDSAGTDLDSIFYTDNGNAGAIGFVASGGQDLGNRYTKSATLGRNIGYKDSAGTDIGYLRGNIAAPTGTATPAVSNKKVGHHETQDQSCDSYGENCSTKTYYERYAKGVFKTTISSSNGMPIASVAYTIQMKVSKAEYTHAIGVNANSTTIPAASGISKKLTTSWADIKSWTVSSTTSSCAFNWEENVRRATKGGPTLYVRVKAVIQNAAGSNTIYTSQQTF